MRSKRRTAADKILTPGRRTWAAALAACALLAVLGLPAAHARGLSVGMRVRQDFYQPLVPVSKAFRTCFKPDASGNPTLSICPEGGAPRAPAGAPASPAPSPRPDTGSPKRSP